MATILVADDDLASRQMLVTLLVYEGHQILEAANGEEALGLALAEHPDLVITDILMPVIDGYEFARQLRDDPEIAQTPIIFYTATYLQSEAHALAKVCGAFRLLTKPAEAEVILKAVEAALSGAAPPPGPLPQEEFDLKYKRLVNDKLVKKVVELEQEIARRIHAEAQIRKLNEELEQRVADRTAQLTVANSELEAFCYSVSHDLRAPLRGIACFTKMLEEDYGGRLDETGHDYLRRVLSASQRMDQLIEDLLNLSRVTRSEMCREKVDLSKIAQTIATALQSTQQARRVEFVIAGGVIANGDPRLLQIGLENLLGNSWKFTARRESARIEFGVTQPEGAPIYFVRDNGAGFDMAYSDKLFGAFQRFHSATEFEGTGIGLATVQRIVHRHGGRVWAEAHLDQGATFYFTL